MFFLFFVFCMVFLFFCFCCIGFGLFAFLFRSRKFFVLCLLPFVLVRRRFCVFCCFSVRSGSCPGPVELMFWSCLALVGPGGLC